MTAALLIGGCSPGLSVMTDAGLYSSLFAKTTTYESLRSASDKLLFELGQQKASKAKRKARITGTLTTSKLSVFFKRLFSVLSI